MAYPNNQELACACADSLGADPACHRRPRAAHAPPRRAARANKRAKPMPMSPSPYYCSRICSQKSPRFTTHDLPYRYSTQRPEPTPVPPVRNSHRGMSPERPTVRQHTPTHFTSLSAHSLRSPIPNTYMSEASGGGGGGGGGGASDGDERIMLAGAFFFLPEPLLSSSST